MTHIESVQARQVLDSRGNPTIEAVLTLKGGITGRAMVPSGASTGTREAVELRDGAAAFGGLGVERAIRNVREQLAPLVIGMDPREQAQLDQAMIDLDGTSDKSRLGANAILAVSLAAAHAAAAAERMPLWRYLRGSADDVTLPTPLMNIVNGGLHADNDLPMQEFMVVPDRATSFAHAVQIGAEVYHTLKRLLHERGMPTGVGDEGGFAPPLATAEQALDLIVEAIELAGHTDVASIALDPAATSFYSDGSYELGNERLSADEMTTMWGELLGRYPIVMLEDPLAEDDWTGGAALTRALGDRVEVVGDDIFVTQRALLERGIREGVANSVLIKPNQAGTLTETMDTIDVAKQAGYQFVISHRSGETDDATIAHLAVATGAARIKSGAPRGMERNAKYNELMRIEQQIADLRGNQVTNL